MEDELANLRLVDDEEEAIQEDVEVVESFSQFCLVGRCLTDSVVHFPSLRNTMADLWHPIGGICITDIGEKRYLFQFFHEVDINRVLAGMPWFFNNHLLILKRVLYGDNPTVLELNSTEFWIQVYELPQGLMFESMAVQLDNFCGQFLEYDTTILLLGQKTYMRIRVRLDVNAPLKRKKKIQVGTAMIAYARFKYEKLSLFYFICGKLGHGESYCSFRLRIKLSKIIFDWDLSLRAVARRRTIEMSKWLRDFDGSQCFTKTLQNVAGGKKNWHNWGEDSSATNGFEKGPMNLMLEEENDPIAMVEGKKRQRVVEGPIDFLGTKAGSGALDLSASSGEQSSRAQ
ncbi:hypothetical protein Gogos_018520 [Gossypium gossypioides]|uniref:DUF4283 domain-containing protein n=1 Tax=Gossypium gossypioides TaxID=34282 RepID=A0A7J9BEB9_GOSGO|nr:hypothetical protein [Gossypium gossypioides]